VQVRWQLGRVKRRIVGPPPAVNLDTFRWAAARTQAEATAGLVRLVATSCARPSDWVLVVGEGGLLHQALEQALDRHELGHRSATLRALKTWTAADADGLVAVLSGHEDAGATTSLGRVLAQHPVLRDRRFEYVSGLEPERAQFDRQDEYSDTWFVSPVLLAKPSPYELYEESLAKFEQKCGLRDFLDLYQWVASVVERSVPGDIAEFGSYRGHSGYLIASTLRALGSDKRLHMFDTFESFPSEDAGVDHFWSDTHDVDYEEVRAKLAEFDNVTLVKGDLTETLGDSDLEPLALAYIDCDSYRADPNMGSIEGRRLTKRTGNTERRT